VQKLIALVFLLLTALLLCGIFGALHDQISYTVSREYFTLFKFVQFGIDPGAGERLGAASVGFQATWWMGIPIGAVLGTVALFAPDARTMLRETLRAFVMVTGVTLVTAILGLLWGWINFAVLSAPAPPDWYVPKGLKNLRPFLCAGAMHNASYLGGVIGLLTGAIRLARRVSKLRRLPIVAPESP
jgi:hypothetical protein